MTIAIITATTILTCLVVGFFIYDTLRWDGRINPSNVGVGDVVNLVYAQPNGGDHKRQFVKVTKIRSLDGETVARLDAKSKYRRDDKDFQRGKVLIQGATSTGEYRQFYAERCIYAHRPILGRFLYRLGVI
jgi:hypothetical protein